MISDVNYHYLYIIISYVNNHYLYIILVMYIITIYVL